jgi:ABC-type branched-subunit amino acid transport system substrate-binding protein
MERNMSQHRTRITRRTAIGAGVAVAALGGRAFAQAAKYGPGASATEIKLGQTMPYSGPASAYGTIGKVEQAYFKMINDNGGINGRKVNLISLDDGYSPPKTVEQVRRLVEQDEVLALYQTLGTPSNSAIHKYVNAKKVPHLLLATGATKWGDPKDYPWTIGFNLTYQSEGQIYAKWLLKNKPNAKIGILYQNDDYGKDVLKGVKDGLGAAGAKMIVKEVTYEVTDPTIDSQILTLQSSGADTFIDITTPKFGAQAVRKAYDSGWKPLHILNNVSASIGSVLVPAGVEKAVGAITVAYYKDQNDPQW